MQGRGNRQAIVQLYGLDLDEAATGEPRQEDVLRHLAVGTRRGAHRIRHAVAVDRHRHVDTLRAAPEAAGRKIEDFGLALGLAQHRVEAASGTAPG